MRQEWEIPLPPEAHHLTGLQLDRAISQVANLSSNGAAHTILMVASPEHECGENDFRDQMDFDGFEFEKFREHVELFDVNVFLAFETTMKMILTAYREAYAKVGFLPDEGETT